MALNINGTTGISGVDASVSAPALTGTDSNTGISFPSADTIKFSTGGVERLSITNSGVTGTGISDGKVKQYKYVSTSTTYSTTSGTYANMSAFDLAITPTSASSILVVQLNIRGAVWHTSGNGGQQKFAISDDDGSSYLSQGIFYPYTYHGGGIYLETADTQIFHVSAANTNARTFKVYHAANSVSNAKVNQNASDISSLQIWEVTT